MFPSYILANLFVKGSLKNNPTGFEMKLKNIIDSGTVVGLGPVTVDDISYPTDKITVKVKDRIIRADQITSANSFMVYVLSDIEMNVEGSPLSPGEHKLGFIIHTREAGRLQFSIEQPLAE
jgi:hypothetical protein